MLGKTAMTSATSGMSKGSIFFLHGTCDSGHGLKTWLSRVLKKEFQFKNYRIIYPSSPIRPYQLMGGQDTAVWYDRLSPGPNMPEDEISINQVGEQLNRVIQEEQNMKEGKVIVGGFSIGGSMALHLGYKFNPNIAGVFALSSFLPPDSSVFSSLEEYVKLHPQVDPDDVKNGHLIGSKEPRLPRVSKNKLPKLLMTRGTHDPLVKSRWTHDTFCKLRDYGVEGHLYTFPHRSHEISPSELRILHNWIDETLSDTPKSKIMEPKPFHVNDEHAVPIPYKWPKTH